MTLSPFLALFWLILCIAVGAAFHTKNPQVITAGLFLVVHQILALSLSVMLESKTIYGLYGMLCLAFFFITSATWNQYAMRWQILFMSGWLAMLSINLFASYTNIQTTLPVWALTGILYAMIGIILNRWWHERGKKLDRFNPFGWSSSWLGQTPTHRKRL